VYVHRSKGGSQQLACRVRHAKSFRNLEDLEGRCLVNYLFAWRAVAHQQNKRPAEFLKQGSIQVTREAEAPKKLPQHCAHARYPLLGHSCTTHRSLSLFMHEHNEAQVSLHHTVQNMRRVRSQQRVRSHSPYLQFEMAKNAL
jgi:hypothetical protein